MSVAAASRIADLSHYLGHRLAQAPVPHSVVSRDQFLQHCDEIKRYGAAMQSRAIPAHRACLERSIELGVSNEFSRRCEHQLERLAEADFTPLDELLGQPTVTTSELSRVGVVADPSPYVVDVTRP